MKGYKYRYVQNLPLDNEPGEIQARLLYSFKSPQSKQTYWVIVDKCVQDIYVIKFHLKAHRYSEYKYNVLTNLHEARTVLYTCIEIMLNEIYANNDTASIGFVGANLIGESVSNTKRFRFYRRFVLTHIKLDNVFEHFINEEKSAYILIPHKALEINPNLPDVYLDMLEDCEEYDSL